MAAQTASPFGRTPLGAQPQPAEPASLDAAVVLLHAHRNASGDAQHQATSTDPVAPARGLVVGLVLGVILWACIVAGVVALLR